MLATVTLLATGLCLPAFGQHFSTTGDASCRNSRASNDVFNAWAETQLTTGSLQGSLMQARIRFDDIWIDSCTVGTKSTSSSCIDSEFLDGDKVAWAAGRTTYPLVGVVGFTRMHYLDSGTPFTQKSWTTTCPPLPDPQVCTGSHCANTPIIVPLRNGNHVKLSAAAHGVPFDLNGDGVLELVAWPEEPAEVGFLAMDRDGDGAITSGKELFGDVTFEGVPTGFHTLGLLPRAPNEGGPGSLKIGRDEGFDNLLLWFDANRNGVSEPDELKPASAYLLEISLNAMVVGKRDQHGNRFRYQGWMRLVDKPAEKLPVYDVILVTQSQ